MTELALPQPEPLPEAIEAGIFCRICEGNLVPSPEEVATITEEHALALISFRLDMETLQRCQRSGANPHTGKQPKSCKQRDANRKQAGKLHKESQINYIGGLAAYEEAFGRGAMNQLKDYVEWQVAQAFAEQEPTQLQLDLF